MNIDAAQSLSWNWNDSGATIILGQYALGGILHVTTNLTKIELPDFAIRGIELLFLYVTYIFYDKKF